MPRCAGPPFSVCPHNAKGSDCDIGFGDDMFCKPCMQKQREYRNTSSENRTDTLTSTKDSSRVLSQTLNESSSSNSTDAITGVTSGSIGDAIVQPVLAYMVILM